MPGARTSARLRKRPRISYAPPPDDLTNNEAAADDATGHNAESESESESSEDEDEDFTLKGRKRKKKSTKKKRGRVTKPKEPKPFRFMDLPAELRNAIYELALTHPEPMRLRDYDHTGRHAVRLTDSTFGRRYAKSREKLPTLIPNLLLLNKAIHAESGSILYQNKLVFYNCTAMWHFLQPLSQTTKSWIKKIALCDIRTGNIAKGYMAPAFQSLIALPNLQSLQFLDFDYWYFTWAFAKMFLREAYYWIDAVGKAKGDRHAAIELLAVDTTMTSVSPASQEDLQKWSRQVRDSIKDKMKYCYGSA
ncbi:Hydrolase [Lasiodiplodia theobromae]|uniref:Hydrolase n=1 Tax=Lasiodiplodia theobromae TaxID=45133 RepID=UPI0015C36CF2|nr:Hydrolase [Lasiodiplodia theobromae]KAF4536385.1 Hydrolase [Lasiodiplodia theobromae]